MRSAGIRVWLDEAASNIGNSLTEKIGHAIEEMDFVGVVLSRVILKTGVWRKKRSGVSC